MGRIREFLNEAIVNKQVQLLLCALARNTHLFRNLWGRLFLAPQGNCTEDLPPCAGQAK